MASKDIDFDEWFSKLKLNDTGCDEFGLSALCQAFQKHALIVTSHKIWNTIPASHGKTPEEERRLCDVHFLYMYHDTYGCLEPRFEWKHEFPIAELQLMPSQEASVEPLANITEKTLNKEASASNIVKGEIVMDTENIPENPEGNVTDELGLVQVPPLPSTDIELPDATENLPVSLPLDDALTDATETVQTETEPLGATDQVSDMPVTVQCSINLTDIAAELVDGKMFLHSHNIPLEPQVIVDDTQYNLRQRQVPTKSVTRPKCKASSNINYGNMDTTTEEDEFSVSESEHMNVPSKSAPSGYRLVTHKYTLAKCSGLIQGPATRTRVMKIPKPEPVSSIDSEATEDYLDPPAPAKRKRKPKKPIKPKRTGTLVTRSYFLRKDGKGTSSKVKPKRKHKFKCPKCQTFCPSVKALNAHFKLCHRKLQCKDCGKFFLTPGSYKLHTYTHQDSQFKCDTCKRIFAFKSQLDQHMCSHTTTRPFHCQETGCDKSFSHEHDLKKHVKSHSGEEHYCTRCDYSNPEECLLNQHMNKHLKIEKMCKKGFIYSNQLKCHYDKGC